MGRETPVGELFRLGHAQMPYDSYRCRGGNS